MAFFPFLLPQHRGAYRGHPTSLEPILYLYQLNLCSKHLLLLYHLSCVHSTQCCIIYTDSTVHYTVDCEWSDQHSIQSHHTVLSVSRSADTVTTVDHMLKWCYSHFGVVSPNSSTVLNGRVPCEIQSHMAHEGKCLFLSVRLSVTHCNYLHSWHFVPMVTKLHHLTTQHLTLTAPHHTPPHHTPPHHTPSHHHALFDHQTST